MRRDRDRRQAAHLHVAADDRGHRRGRGRRRGCAPSSCRSASAIASMARCDSEPLPIEPKLYLPGFALQKRDQLRDAVNHNVGIHRERARLRHQLGDRRDVGLGVVGQLGEQQRVDGERPADADPDGGAVGRGLGHRVGADVAAGAGLVVDDERLAELFLQMVGDQAGDHVGRRARRRTAPRSAPAWSASPARTAGSAASSRPSRASDDTSWCFSSSSTSRPR